MNFIKIVIFAIFAINLKADSSVVNLMWLDKKHQKTMSDKNVSQITQSLNKWLQCIRNGDQIVVWYNSAKYYENVKEKLEKELTTKLEKSFSREFLNKTILFKDIQIVLSERIASEVFRFLDVNVANAIQKKLRAIYSKDSKIPIYFQVDLARFIITNYQIVQKGYDHIIFSDLDVVPKNLNSILSVETKKILENYKIMFLDNSIDLEGKIINENEGGFLGFENSFMIATISNRLALAIQKFLIPVALEYAKNWKNPSGIEGCKDILEQKIYGIIPLMISYLYSMLFNDFRIVNRENVELNLGEIALKNPEKFYCLIPNDEFLYDLAIVIGKKVFNLHNFLVDSTKKFNKTGKGGFPIIPTILLKAPISNFSLK